MLPLRSGWSDIARLIFFLVRLRLDDGKRRTHQYAISCCFCRRQMAAKCSQKASNSALSGRSPMVQPPFYGGAGSRAGQEGYLGFLVAAPQLAVSPLTQFYEECLQLHTIRVDGDAEFCSIPPPFRGTRRGIWDCFTCNTYKDGCQLLLGCQKAQSKIGYCTPLSVVQRLHLGIPGTSVGRDVMCHNGFVPIRVRRDLLGRAV